MSALDIVVLALCVAVSICLVLSAVVEHLKAEKFEKEHEIRMLQLRLNNLLIQAAHDALVEKIGVGAAPGTWQVWTDQSTCTLLAWRRCHSLEGVKTTKSEVERIFNEDRPSAE